MFEVQLFVFGLLSFAKIAKFSSISQTREGYLHLDSCIFGHIKTTLQHALYYAFCFLLYLSKENYLKQTKCLIQIFLLLLILTHVLIADYPQ